MELLGPNGDKFELILVRYQFPHSTDEFDANWLMVRTVCSIGGREWSSEDPALLTWEVEALANWLADIAQHHQASDSEDFLEPNISFKFLGRAADKIRLQILLELESRAPWREWVGPGKCPEGPIVECSRPELLQWVEDLRQQLKPFPRR